MLSHLLENSQDSERHLSYSNLLIIKDIAKDVDNQMAQKIDSPNYTMPELPRSSWMLPSNNDRDSALEKFSKYCPWRGGFIIDVSSFYQ